MRKQFSFSPNKSLLNPVNETPSMNFLKIANRKRQIKIDYRKSLNRATEHQRNEETKIGNLSPKHQGALLKIDLKSRPSIEAKHNPFEDHDLRQTFLHKD